jgi:hypothetical protein
MRACIVLSLLESADSPEVGNHMSDPIPIGVPVTDLRPTQMTVGFREVEIKRRQWREANDEARAKGPSGNNRIGLR